MKKTKLAIASVLYILLSDYSIAQESITSSGNTTNNTSGNVSYSVGQPFYIESKGSNGSSTNGVQQTYLISDVSTTEIIPNISFNIFPNPTIDLVTIQVNSSTQDPISYELFDETGRIIEKGSFIEIENKMSFINYVNGNYLLKLKSNGKSKSYNIIKTK
jgi:hypothetical protein